MGGGPHMGPATGCCEGTDEGLDLLLPDWFSAGGTVGCRWPSPAPVRCLPGPGAPCTVIAEANAGGRDLAAGEAPARAPAEYDGGVRTGPAGCRGGGRREGRWAVRAGVATRAGR